MSLKNPYTVPNGKGRISHKRFPKNVKAATLLKRAAKDRRLASKTKSEEKP